MRLHAGDLLVALVLGLGQPGARIEAERPQRAALVLVLRDRAVGLRDLGAPAARSRCPGTSRTPGRRWRGTRSSRSGRRRPCRSSGRCPPTAACPSLVLNGPEALIRTGLSSPGLPFSWIDASSFRSALVIDELNALSSRSCTFSLSSPPPQEARASVAKSRTRRRRRTRRRVAGPPQLDALSDVGQPDGVREANRRDRRCRGAHPRRTRPRRAGDRRGRRSRPARGGPRRSDPRGGRARNAHRGERLARPGPLLHEARPPRGLLGVAQGAPPQEHQQVRSTGAGARPTCARSARSGA